MTPDVDALSSEEMRLIVYMLKMGRDMFINAVLVIYSSAVQEKIFKREIAAKGTIERTCVSVIVATGPNFSHNLGANKLAIPIAAFEIANNIPISVSLAANFAVRYSGRRGIKAPAPNPINTLTTLKRLMSFRDFIVRIASCFSIADSVLIKISMRLAKNVNPMDIWNIVR